MTEKGKYRVCGALAGTVNGLFGGGGGIPLAFLLRSWAKLSGPTALATCVAVIFPFCLVSVLVYAFRAAPPRGEAPPHHVGGLAGGWIGGRPVTPRNGYQVEVNALWYNAVRYTLELARSQGDTAFVKAWEALPERIETAFREPFALPAG